MEQQQQLTPASQAAGAYRATRAIALVEGKSPGALVVVLVEDALDRLDGLAGALRFGNALRARHEYGKISDILASLRGALDPVYGSITADIARIYLRVDDLAQRAIRDNRPDLCDEAHDLLQPIAMTWAALLGGDG